MQYKVSNKSCKSVGLIDQKDCDLIVKGVNLHSDEYARVGREKMHRIVMRRILCADIPKGYVVDHINRNRLDNRRPNLRLATIAENARNTGKYKGSSRFIGVSWKDSKKKWYAQIKVNNKVKYLGVFDSEIQAAQRYNEAAIEYHGDFATLNEL